MVDPEKIYDTIASKIKEILPDGLIEEEKNEGDDKWMSIGRQRGEPIVSFGVDPSAQEILFGIADHHFEWYYPKEPIDKVVEEIVLLLNLLKNNRLIAAQYTLGSLRLKSRIEDRTPDATTPPFLRGSKLTLGQLVKKESIPLRWV